MCRNEENEGSELALRSSSFWKRSSPKSPGDGWWKLLSSKAANKWWCHVQKKRANKVQLFCACLPYPKENKKRNRRWAGFIHAGKNLCHVCTMSIGAFLFQVSGDAINPASGGPQLWKRRKHSAKDAQHQNWGKYSKWAKQGDWEMEDWFETPQSCAKTCNLSTPPGKREQNRWRCETHDFSAGSMSSVGRNPWCSHWTDNKATPFQQTPGGERGLLPGWQLLAGKM